jgi:stage V sporulation protein B
MAMSSPAVVMLALVQTLSGTLQGMGKVKIPVLALAVGALTKVLLTYILVGIPQMNIAGACLGTVVCYSIASWINIHWAGKILGKRLQIGLMAWKPLVASTVMALAVSAVVYFASAHLEDKWMALVGVCVGGAVYALVLLAIGGIGKEEMVLFSGMRKSGRKNESAWIEEK